MLVCRRPRLKIPYVMVKTKKRECKRRDWPLALEGYEAMGFAFPWEEVPAKCGCYCDRSKTPASLRPFGSAAPRDGGDRCRSRCRLWTRKEVLWLCLIMLGLTFCSAPPVCAQTVAPLRYTIREEMPPNTFVGNIARDTGLIATQGMELELQDPLLDQGGPYFRLNTTTGILVTVRAIDRERICANWAEGAPCLIKFTVRQTRPFFHVIKVEVYVEDVNDHSPHFPEGRIARTISETTKPDTTFSIPAAEDLDDGINSVQNYELISETNKFALQFTNDSGIIQDLNLVLKAPLDREVEQSYSLIVTAKDGGNPARTGSMVIEIVVGDANDNNPKFDNDTYEVTIPENVAEHTKVLQVHAYDPDSGLNGDLVYSFAPATAEKYGSMFMINAISGGIYIKSEVDHEEQDTYILTVTAKDRGPNSLPAYAKVVIHVGDINDHAPYITINSLDSREVGSGDSAFIKENLDVGTFVAHVSVTDPDVGPSGLVSCKLLPNPFFELKVTARTSYQIISRTRFDREDLEEYHITLSCTDHGDPQLTSTKDIAVRVIDVNDHGPQFSRPAYVVEINENNPPDQIIIQVNASDDDAGRNAAIKYVLEDEEDEAYVRIEPISGIVRAQVSFDYETEDRYEFVILAIDQGSDSHTATTTLILNIVDVNDGRPQFSQKAYSFKIFENMPEQIKVGLLSASDADGPPFNDIIYSLSPASEGIGAFAINSINGELTTKKELDREEQEVYHLVAVATNRGYTNVNSSVNITVTVIDQNDNGPIFVFPTTWNNTVQVPDDITIGEVVAKVEAKDADRGANGQLVYLVVKGNESFSIEPHTGIIRVIDELRCLAVRTCRVGVLVRDGGTPQRTNRAELTVMPKSASAFGRSLEAMFFFSGTNIIIIIAASVISLLLIILILVVFCRRRRRRRRRSDKKRDREDAKVTSVTDSTDGEISVKSLKNGKLPNGCYDGVGNTSGKQRKGVKFIDTVGMRESSTDDLSAPWPPKLDSNMIENPRTRSSSLDSPPVAASADVPQHTDDAPSASSSSTDKVPTVAPWIPRHGIINPQMATPPLKRSSPIAHLTEMEIEMAEVLQMLSREQDSETGSITDSGRGPSEEGDNNRPSPLDPNLSEDHKGCHSGADGRVRGLDGTHSSDLLRSKSSELFASFKRPDSAGSKSCLRHHAGSASGPPSSTMATLAVGGAVTAGCSSGKHRSAGSHIPPPPPPPSMSSYSALLRHKPTVAPMETIPQEGVIQGGMSSFRPSSGTGSGSWFGGGGGGHSYQRSTDSTGSSSTSSGPLSKFRFQSKKGSSASSSSASSSCGSGGDRREPPYQTMLANLSGRLRTCAGATVGAAIVETNLDDPVDTNGNKDKRSVNFDLGSTLSGGGSGCNNNSGVDGGVDSGSGRGGGHGEPGRGGSLKRRTVEYAQRPSSGYSSGSDTRLYKDPRPADPPLVVYDTSPSERHQQQMEMTSLRPVLRPADHGLHGRRGWARDATDGLSDDSTTTSGSYVLNVDDGHRDTKDTNIQEKHFVV